MWIGNLIALLFSAIALVMPCLIHQYAYVENLYPLAGSNFSTPLTNPIVPSWIKSRSSMFLFVYFFATLTTSLKFAATILSLAR